MKIYQSYILSPRYQPDVVRGASLDVMPALSEIYKRPVIRGASQECDASKVALTLDCGCGLSVQRGVMRELTGSIPVPWYSVTGTLCASRYRGRCTAGETKEDPETTTDVASIATEFLSGGQQ